MRTLPEGENVGGEFAVPGEQVGVTNPDLAGLAGLERKDPNAEEFLIAEFEEGGIESAADDILVNLSRLFGIEKFAFGEFSVDVHGEGIDPGVFRDWEKEGSLDPSICRVVEGLCDGGGGHLAADLGFHLGFPGLDGEVSIDGPRRSGKNRGAWDDEDRFIGHDESLSLDELGEEESSQEASQFFHA